jgi:tape measure domain-containing protein
MAQDLKVGIKITADGKQAVGEVSRVNSAIGDIGESAPGARKTADAIDQVGDSSAKARDRVDTLATGLKALAGAAVVREFISANASIESIGASLEAVTGSAESAAAEMAFIRNEAMRLGVETAEAARSFLTLAAATKGTNLEGQATRDIWSAVAGRMTQLGATSADVAGAMTQLAQGASKGKFELEDLKSIAERIPGFFSTFAKAIGVTNERFFEMVSAGEITADLLPKLAGALGGAGGEINTFNATLGRMKNALTEVATSIGDTGIFDALTFTMGKLAGALSYATLGFKGMAAAIKGDQATFNKLSDQAEQVKNRLFGIGDGAKQAKAEMQAWGGASEKAADQVARSLIKLDGSIKDTAEAFKTLGIDPGEITNGISAAERSIIESFKRLAADPNTNGAVLTTALLAALGKVSQEAVPEIGFAYKAAARAGRQSSDELAAGMNALQTKAKGLWEGMADGSKKAAAANADYEKSLQSMLERAASLRAKAAGEREQDNSIEGQASAMLDLIAAEQKLQRLKSGGGSLAEVEKQAELVRQTAGYINDQARAKEAVSRSYTLEAEAIERTAAAAQQVKTSSGLKILADGAVAELEDAMKRIESMRNQTIQVRIIPVGADGLPWNSDDLASQLRSAALKVGSR